MKIFESKGENVTPQVIEIATNAAKEMNITKIVTASSTGASALRFCAAWPGSRLVVVRYVHGFETPNQQEMPPESEKQLLAQGCRIVTAAHAFGGIGRAVRRKFQTTQTDEIIANVLRIFGQGVKVGCEISLMACDAGLVQTDEKIIACGGSGRGLDTALVLTPANTHSFFDLRVHEILCKAR